MQITTFRNHQTNNLHQFTHPNRFGVWAPMKSPKLTSHFAPASPKMTPSAISKLAVSVVKKQNGRICTFVGCGKRRNFGNEGGKRQFCGIHKLPGMVNLKQKMCRHDGCITAASFGKEGGKPQFCGKHKLSGMVNIVCQRCEFEGCITAASFGNEGGKAQFCSKHKLADMVNVVTKRCKEDGCMTQPHWGIPGHRPIMCFKHKEVPITSQEDGSILSIIKNPNSKCSHTKCREPAVWGIRNPDRCESHRYKDDLNLVEEPCKACGLVWRLDPCTRKCEYCDPKTQHNPRLAKQREVKQYLQHGSKVPMWSSYDSTPVDLKACGDRERPDFLWELPAWCVVLEVDEHQHNERAEFCECARMVNITQSLGRPTLWIRYNPDKYKPVATGQRQVHRKKRLQLLGDCILHSLEMLPEGVLEKGVMTAVMKLFFDGFDSQHSVQWEFIS